MSLEEYFRAGRITSFALGDDNSLIIGIIECSGYSLDKILSLLKSEDIEINESDDNSTFTMTFYGESAHDALFLIQMNLNDNFEDLIMNSKDMEFYELSSLTRSYRDASDRITNAMDRLRYKGEYSELLLQNSSEKIDS